MVDLTQDIVLENDRVLLRPLQAGDIDNLKHFVNTQPEIWSYSLVQVSNEAELKAYMDTALANRAASTEYPFIVYDKLTGAYAGSTRFYDIQPVQQTVQLGYTWYGKEFQGTGLNRHCKFLLLQFAFEKMEVARVEFRADNNNKRSIAAMKSIGCVEEGVLRSHLIKAGGGRRDSIILSILRSEWEASVKQNLQHKIQG